MNMSQPVDWIKKPFVGYMMNAEFSDENATNLQKLIDQLAAEFGDALYCMPRESLHVTLLDWIAPLVDYEGQEKSALYEKIREEYDQAVIDILSPIRPIQLHFTEIKVAPTTVFITGQDDGEFQAIRDQFVEKVNLLPGTKLPPTIVHSSLARFTKPIDLDAVNAFLADKKIDFTQEVTNFRLIHSTREPLVEFETLKRYQLNGSK